MESEIGLGIIVFIASLFILTAGAAISDLVSHYINQRKG